MKQTDIVYTINNKYYIEIRERKCYNTFRLRLFNSNKERVDEICCPKQRYNHSMQRLIKTAEELEMHYVMRNKETGEMTIIPHIEYRNYDLLNSHILYTHSVIYAASYEECLEYCEKEIGYKED